MRSCTGPVVRNLPRMRRLVVLAFVVPLAACGSSPKHVTPPPASTPAGLLGAGGRVLYAGGNWAVVVNGTQAVAARRVAGRWRADRTGVVKLTILGPHPGGKAAPTPQVAAEVTGTSHLVEEGLWVDGRELLEKGGGTSPARVTVYGAPDRKLAKGRHVAVAYGRTQAHGTAVAWAFTVV